MMQMMQMMQGMMQMMQAMQGQMQPGASAAQPDAARANAARSHAPCPDKVSSIRGGAPPRREPPAETFFRADALTKTYQSGETQVHALRGVAARGLRAGNR